MSLILPAKHALLSLSAQEFTDLCKPLELFNIHHFTYQKQYNNGHRVTLCNKPNWIYDYYNLRLFNTSLFEHEAPSYKENYEFWLDEYDLSVYTHGRDYYQSRYSITITQPQLDGCEFYLFASAEKYKESILYLSHHKEILYHFILYLKDRAASLFKKAKKHSILIKPNFPDSHFSDYFIKNKQLTAQLEDAKKRFFQTTRIYKYVFEAGEEAGVKLTNREIDCIYYLLQNKTAEETASLMNITRRTVEYYLDNIKSKLNCDSKLSLVKKLTPYKILETIR